MGLKIYPMVAAELHVDAGSLCLFAPKDDEFGKRAFGDSYNGTVSIPIIIWYIGGGPEKVLVDTSFEEKEYPEGGPLIRPEWRIEKSLSRMGVKPEDIDLVINTHLHNDHFGNNEMFTNARFIIQKDEIPLAIAPPKWAPYYFKGESHHILNVVDRIEAVDGEREIAKGITVVRLGGHTPGSQAVIVEFEGKRAAIAGDVVPTFFNMETFWPNGNYWDLEELVHGMQYLKANSDAVLPSHDWRLFTIYQNGVVQ